MRLPQRQQSEITPYDLFNPPLKRQTRFPAPPPYPTGAFKFKYFRYPPNERPCNSYWMDPAGCGLGNRCKYVHDCDWTRDEFLDYRLFVKSTPCQVLVKRGRCDRGEQCPHGHRCPYTERTCPHRSKCHFREAGLPHST